MQMNTSTKSMKYTVSWRKPKKKSGYTAKQCVVVYNLDDAQHIMENLAKDPAITCIDVMPVFGS